ncbi:YidC/Oxa1 family membrane protein insertase [Qiania dongpingensis]|uniref:YidC/Oxa1 family membrane protein insertase n=1 Tax=Qiania dongpingensis TaxID=2763669 RepID=A0A7G9G104_9FIRM|nr:YidC/Oxa1 family membrane protein insertase [Qiania dongpingensis]QNM04486.1 YidC/Oxa1 family membrane protein insertase [Qiania dongpingensis]
MDFLLLTKSTTFIIGPIATVLGYIMEGIYNLGVHNIAACIILFTIIVNLILLPLTIKQQKFMKLNAVMQPEIAAIQKKYKGKQQDQAAMQKQNMEVQAVYQKYGTTPTGGCLQTVLQLPIMFALYQVIYRIPAYVSGIKEVLMNVVTPVMQQPGYIDKIAELATSNKLPIEKIDYSVADKMVDLFGKFNAAAWNQLKEIFPSLQNVISENSDKFLHMNSLFGGMNLTEAPGFKISVALIIPILAGLTQWLSVKTMNTAPTDPDAPGAGAMKSMNTVMPIMSVIFCISFPIGIGIYWVASSTVRMVMQLGINQYMKKINVDDMIKANIEKKNKKRQKKGLPPINANATIKSANKASEVAAKKKEMEEERAKKAAVNSTDYYKNKSENLGTIASRARMVQNYNEKKGKK